MITQNVNTAVCGSSPSRISQLPTLRLLTGGVHVAEAALKGIFFENRVAAAVW
jgi:hypothetical protein